MSYALIFFSLFLFGLLYFIFSFRSKKDTVSSEPDTKRNKKPKLPDHDPKDYRKSDSSTDWSFDAHYCNDCRCSTGHQEFMSDVCRSCGGFKTQFNSGRSWRRIVQNGKWVFQVKYQDGTEEIIKEWFKNIVPKNENPV